MKGNTLEKFEHVLEEKGLVMPEDIKSKVFLREYPANYIICSAGTPVHNIQLLVKGEVIILNAFSDGKEYAFASENTFTLLGDIEYFSGNLIYASSVISKTCTVFMRLDFNSFKRWIDEDQVLYELIVRHLAIKCYKGTIKQGNIKFENAKTRVIKLMLALEQPIDKSSDKVQVECSHYEIARMAGMSERTVARVLKEMKDENLIKLKYGKIIIDVSNIEKMKEMI